MYPITAPSSNQHTMASQLFWNFMLNWALHHFYNTISSSDCWNPISSLNAGKFYEKYYGNLAGGRKDQVMRSGDYRLELFTPGEILPWILLPRSDLFLQTLHSNSLSPHPEHCNR